MSQRITSFCRIQSHTAVRFVSRGGGVPPHLSHIFIIDVGLVQRGYSIPSPVLLKCGVASIVARSIVLYGTCTGLYIIVWGFVSLGSTYCDRFLEVHL